MTAANGALPDYQLVALTHGDLGAVLRIFNSHVASGFAAYPEEPVSEEAMAALLRETEEYTAIAAKGSDGALLGFGLLRPYSPHSTFSRTAQVTYFLDADCLRKGIGTALLTRLEEEARRRGITGILAHVSSRNPASLAFHAKHGFIECGRFPKIGRKWGKPFDVVWLIKDL